MAMQISKHTVGYLTYHAGARSMISTSVVRDTGMPKERDYLMSIF